MRSSAQPNVRIEDDVIEGEFEEVATPLATVRRTGNMQQIKTQYISAIRCEVPRNMDLVMKRVVREAELAADDFMYSWTQGKGADRSIIEGISIDGAMILSRNYGNCIPEIEITEDAPSYWMFRATFIDLETGATLPRLFRKSKSGVHGKHDAERKLDIALQIGQSKAQRNVIVKAMPVYLVKAAIQASKRAVIAAIKDLPAAITHAIAAFAKLTVTEAELEAYLGASKPQWNAVDIARLRATWKAIDERQTSVDQEFRTKDEDDAPAIVTPDKAAAAKTAENPVAEEINVITGEVTTPVPEPAQSAPAHEADPSPPASAQAAPPTDPAAAVAAAPEAAKSEPKAVEVKPKKEPPVKKEPPPSREPGED